MVAVALATCGAATSASAAPAAPAPAPATSSYDGYGGGPNGQPIQMGPFSFPARGQVGGNFAWDTSNGGY